MQTLAVNRLELIAELRQAIPKHQMQLHFQPIVDMATGHIVKAEASLRWCHPERGMLLPPVFIDVAEETA